MTKEYEQHTNRENLSFEDALTEEDQATVTAILSAAEKIAKSISFLSQSHGRADFILAISQKDNFPIKTQEYGQVENIEQDRLYSHLNIEKVVTNPDAVSSSEKNDSPEHIGAIAFGKWILSVRGFINPKMNAAVALGIGFGARLISYQDAEKLARNQANCVSEYMEHEGAFTDPFLSKTKDDFVEPLSSPQGVGSFLS